MDALYLVFLREGLLLTITNKSFPRFPRNQGLKTQKCTIFLPLSTMEHDVKNKHTNVNLQSGRHITRWIIRLIKGKAYGLSFQLNIWKMRVHTQENAPYPTRYSFVTCNAFGLNTRIIISSMLRTIEILIYHKGGWVIELWQYLLLKCIICCKYIWWLVVINNHYWRELGH